MAYVIAEPCIDVKDTACVDACPVDCIHVRKNESDFAGAAQLYIDPVECIDCGACVPVCPVSAIFCPGGFTGKMEALHTAECGSLCSQVIVKLGVTDIWKSRRRNERS
jgi:NAD-dependent dihydropyrimidine dehydrogenase PreA subunit